MSREERRLSEERTGDEQFFDLSKMVLQELYPDQYVVIKKQELLIRGLEIDSVKKELKNLNLTPNDITFHFVSGK